MCLSSEMFCFCAQCCRVSLSWHLHTVWCWRRKSCMWSDFRRWRKWNILLTLTSRASRIHLKCTFSESLHTHTYSNYHSSFIVIFCNPQPHCICLSLFLLSESSWMKPVEVPYNARTPQKSPSIFRRIIALYCHLFVQFIQLFGVVLAKEEQLNCQIFCWSSN